MGQPGRWLWGIVPLALLWGAGNLFIGTQIENDVAIRAQEVASRAAGSAPGARPVVARVQGRDVEIGGEALTADGASRAVSQLKSEFGVRRVTGGLTQVVAQKPYSWSATLRDGRLLVEGHVPDMDLAAANLAAARTARPNLQIVDRQTAAFGAPEGFGAVSVALLGELRRLSTGKISIDDLRYCVEGVAATPEDFTALSDLGTRITGKFQAVSCGLEPPSVSPYRWSIERPEGGGLVVSGFHPPGLAKTQIAEIVRKTFPEPATIADDTRPATGAPPALIAMVGRAARDLSRLRQGKAEIVGGTYELNGAGPDDHEACIALRLQIAQEDGPDSVAQATISCPPAPPPVTVPLPEMPPLVLPEPTKEAAAPQQPVEPSGSSEAAATEVGKKPDGVPFRWRATLSDGRIVLEGFANDRAQRDKLLATLRALFPGAAIEDRLEITALNQAVDADAATRLALAALAKLGAGSVSIAEGKLSIEGAAPGTAARRDIVALLSPQGLPTGLELGSDPSALPLRPYELSISRDRDGLRLSGSLPDEASRQAIAALAAASPGKLAVQDQAVVAADAPKGFAALALATVSNLLRLDLGSAEIGRDTVRIRGLTCRDLIQKEVETTSRTELPAGYKADIAIALRQTGCTIDPPNTCQTDLDALTKRSNVMFGQATTVLGGDTQTEQVVADATAILKQCPAARIVIEGHANHDGERGGFDNLGLSTRRAQRVHDELVARGIPDAQLSVKGFGVTRPLLPREDREARASNRRVQFTVAK